MENKLPKIDLHAPTDPDYFKRIQASKERAVFFKKHESRNPELWEHRLMESIGCHTTGILMQALSVWRINDYLTPHEVATALRAVDVETTPTTIGEFLTMFREGYEEKNIKSRLSMEKALREHFSAEDKDASSEEDRGEDASSR